jgi:hypothetical protein
MRHTPRTPQPRQRPKEATTTIGRRTRRWATATFHSELLSVAGRSIVAAHARGTAPCRDKGDAGIHYVADATVAVGS